MALVKENDLTKGLSGRFGDILFKQIGERTFAYPVPARTKKQSEKQRANRSKFRDATRYAHAAMLNEKKKAHYQKLAKRLQLPNAYTAAITDYMRKPVISDVDTDQYKGKPGGKIRIEAHKKQIPLDSVNVVISSSDHQIIEQGPARRETLTDWHYQSKLISPHHYTSYYIRITATDITGQSVDTTISG